VCVFSLRNGGGKILWCGKVMNGVVCVCGG